MFEAGDTQRPQDLREDIGNTDEPPVVKADPKDWFKKPERPLTLDPRWNECKNVDSKPTQKWLSDLAQAKKSSKKFDDLMSTLIDFNAFAMNCLQIIDFTQDILVGPTYQLLKGTCRSYIELEYNMKECYNALNDQVDWNNPKGDRYPFDLSKPLTLNHQKNMHDFFDKAKAAKYDLQGIEDMVPNLWSPAKVAYNKHALLGTSHWRSKRQTFYGYANNKVSKHDVYSTKRVLAMKNVKVNVWYGYGHLEEIENRLFNLKGEDIVHLAAALRMFTRRIVIQKRVEDL
nr:hypothetical protein [Tanacetum cinerariifolium]